VTEDVTINGNNATVSVANAFRVFDLGVVTVSISNLGIANGNTAGFGGAINMSDGIGLAGTTLTLTHVFFSGTHADFGGAIHEPRGTLTVDHSNFSGNTAVTGGCAIGEERNGSKLTVVNSIFNNNTAVGSGGAMALLSDATISDSSFTGNSAEFGGAISILLGDLNLIDSVFNKNIATIGGGAINIISVIERIATLTNVTINGNAAKNNGWGSSPTAVR
jgi:hypothetical protein